MAWVTKRSDAAECDKGLVDFEIIIAARGILGFEMY